MATRRTRKKGLFEKAEKTHPLKTMVYFILAGITMLFLTLMVLFAFNNPGALLAGKHFPKLFFFSTGIIICSSATVEAARRAYLRDDGAKLLNNLMLTMLLAIAFAVVQYFGWMQLWDSGITLYNVRAETGEVSTPGGAFLFVISGLHVLHLLGGIIFLFLAMFKVVNVRSDDVRSVVYFSNRLEEARIDMLAKYWHFLDALWCILFLYFLWFFV